MPLSRIDAQRTGRSPYRIPAQAPQEQWRFKTRAPVVSAPTVGSDGTVYFGGLDYRIYALAADGAPRWQLVTRDMVFSAVALGKDGLLYVGSDDDRLRVLRPQDGSLVFAKMPGTCRWSSGRGPEAARCDLEDVTIGPDGTLYVTGDGIYAVATDGTIRWRHPAEKKTHCTSAPALAPNGTVYAVCQDALIALGPDGSKRWELAAPGELESPPAVAADGTLFIGTEGKRLLIIDPAVQPAMPGPPPTASAKGAAAAAEPTGPNGQNQFNPSNAGGAGPAGGPSPPAPLAVVGQIRMSIPTSGPVRAAVALRADGSVVLATLDGRVEARRADGSLLWTFVAADGILSSPIVDADGAVLFGSRDDRLYALEPDGRLRWSVLLDGDVDGTPALAPDGTIYVGADDHALHALR